MAGIGSQTPIQAGIKKPPALIIVLDISSSMTAEDFKPENRLQEAKKDLKNFIANNPHAVIGLMVFAAVPRLLVPLTSDQETVLKALEKAAPAGYGEDGTAIGSGIASAVNRLRNGTWASRKILLITDGVNNRGALTPLDAARLARELGISIHAVGIGTNEMARYFVPSAAGSLIEVRARIDIDDEALAALAQATDGSYQRVRSSEELGRALASISLGEARAESASRAGEESFWVRACAWTALLLLTVEFALVQFVISEVPG
jgi:Ca-activated chloride channel family protein